MCLMKTVSSKSHGPKYTVLTIVTFKMTLMYDLAKMNLMDSYCVVDKIFDNTNRQEIKQEAHKSMYTLCVNPMYKVSEYNF